MFDLLILGAGASGITAAITAAKRGKSVCLLEKYDCIAPKIPATGNGRCNFTNALICPDCYHGNGEWISYILSAYPVQSALDYFGELGIFPSEKNGYYYPYSNQAKTVVKAFEEAIISYGIRVELNWETLSVLHNERGFSIKNQNGKSVSGSNLLFACGLIDAKGKGLETDAFSFIGQLGHSLRKPLPALCGFYCDGLSFKRLSGVRQNAKITLVADGKEQGCDSGEVQFTEYGLSGIPVFQLSSEAVFSLEQGQKTEFELNLIQGLPEERVTEMLKERLAKGLAPLNGLLSDKLEKELLYLFRESDQTFESLWKLLTHLRVSVCKVRDFKYAQTARGGIPFEEIDYRTLESKQVKGLYFSGELLDVDGICGGYNLHWAWATGTIVGKQI